jgi:photosystem II stability/assembly factor-like uncharacterized protein
LAVSGDAGATWRACAPPLSAQISALAISGAGDELLVGTASGQVLASEDGGASWRTLAEFPGTLAIAVASAGTLQDPSTYVVTAQPLESGLWQLALRRSASAGTLYTCEAAQPAAQLALAGDGRLACALHERVVCLHGGQLLGESAPLEGEPIASLAAVGDPTPNSGWSVWAGARAGLCRSVDGGRTWETVSSDLSVVALHAKTPGRVYAVTMGGRLWEIEG